MDSDVPSQALNARLIALLLPFWLEGLGDRSCRGEGGTWRRRWSNSDSRVGYRISVCSSGAVRV